MESNNNLLKSDACSLFIVISFLDVRFFNYLLVRVFDLWFCYFVVVNVKEFLQNYWIKWFTVYLSNSCRYVWVVIIAVGNNFKTKSSI